MGGSREPRAPGDVLVHLRRARDHADRHYAEPVDLDTMASVAGLSRYHFLRLFRPRTGSRRRPTCRSAGSSGPRTCCGPRTSPSPRCATPSGSPAWGRSAPGSARSSGETPTEFQRRYADGRAPHPRVLRLHVGPGRDAAAASQGPQSGRSAGDGERSYARAMITNISIVSVFVKDQDESKKFYTDVLGFEEKDDITLGDGYRWCTVVHPAQPELQVNLAVPGPPLAAEMVEAIRRSQDEGGMHGIGLRVDDCQKTFEELSAKGVEFLQPPGGAAYGTEALAGTTPATGSSSWSPARATPPTTSSDGPSAGGTRAAPG